MNSCIDLKSECLCCTVSDLSAPSQHTQMLHHCADGMVFGALKPCPQCGGQLQIRSHCYQCTGNISAWTKCTHTTDDPDRGEWVIPEDLLDIPFLWVHSTLTHSHMHVLTLAHTHSHPQCTYTLHILIPAYTSTSHSHSTHPDTLACTCTHPHFHSYMYTPSHIHVLSWCLCILRTGRSTSTSPESEHLRRSWPHRFPPLPPWMETVLMDLQGSLHMWMHL